MATHQCSPDSSFPGHLLEKKKKKEKRHAERKKTWAQIGSERDKLDDIQNHAINSTQDVEKNPSDSAGRGRKRSKLQSRLKAKVKRLTLEHYNPILELDEIEIEFERWQNEHITLNIKSLSDFCNEKEKLAKEVFSIINKKEFKKLLPTNLQKYNARDVRNWCVYEIENTAEDKLLAMLKGHGYIAPDISANEPSVNEVLKNEADETGKEKGKEISDFEKSSEERNSSVAIDNSDTLNEAMEVKSDQEVFQDIIKTPDQNEMDELLNEDVENVQLIQQHQNDDQGTTEKGVQYQKEKQLVVLEMELRARALKSFIKAQEKKKDANINENKQM